MHDPYPLLNDATCNTATPARGSVQACDLGTSHPDSIVLVSYFSPQSPPCLTLIYPPSLSYCTRSGRGLLYSSCVFVMGDIQNLSSFGESAGSQNHVASRTAAFAPRCLVVYQLHTV